MNKKEYVKEILWITVIITNIIFWSYLYMDIKLKAQRLVFQVNDLVISDKRVNKDKDQYMYANNGITFSNLLLGKKVSNIYSKEYSKAKVFKRYICQGRSNTLEYSRQDDNLLYNEDATLKYQNTIKIPLFAIIKTYFVETQRITVEAKLNDLPLKLAVSYLSYDHACGTFPDWSIKL